ncbi:hypothetical protein WS65_00620 [Burkholderia anthina]|nr:hypothetical protein WS65_00620 [Burkholderia anthina]
MLACRPVAVTFAIAAIGVVLQLLAAVLRLFLTFPIPRATALIALVVLGEKSGGLACWGMALAAAGLYRVMRY